VRFVIDEAHGHGLFYLPPTGEVLRANPAEAETEGPPPRLAGTSALCVRSTE
jgi:hypothetical protein